MVNGKLPQTGGANFIITLKGNVGIGDYSMVFTDSVSRKIYDVTLSVKHRVQKWLAVEPTCNSYGNIVHWECLECHKYFTEEECIHETTKEAMRLDPLPHTYDGGVITTQPTTTSTGIKTYTCTGCGHKTYETVQVAVQH